MQGIGYTLRVWFSGMLFTPVIYCLLLMLYSGFQLPPALGTIILSLVIPYTVLISVWVALALFCTIVLAGNRQSLKLYLSLVGFTVPFAALSMIHFISALQSYSGGYLLALAYALSTLVFIWRYNTNFPGGKSIRVDQLSKAIRDAAIYALTVWLFTFLLSSPVSIVIWMMTKDYKPVSAIKTTLDIVERYNFQLSLSIAYLITLFLTSLIVIGLDLPEKKKKVIILLFALPLTFPMLFYYLLFSAELFTRQLMETLILIVPSMLVAALCIGLVGIGRKAPSAG